MEDEPVFVDAESYQGGGANEKLTFPMIVLSYLQKIGTLAATEMRGGYWNQKPHPNPNINITVDEYVPDSRETFSNAVMYLYTILYPHFDKQMLEVGRLLERKIQVVYRQTSVIVERDAEAKTSDEAKKSKEATVKDMEFRAFPSDKYKVSYRSLRLEICWQIFRELCCFLKRQDYFKSKTFEEEV